MKIFPAIDLLQGRAVRLMQGDYDKETVYSHSPLDVALEFEKTGASYLHLVDLDGAKDGTPTNFESIREIVENTRMFVEVGGGIRNEERLTRYLEIGVNRVILGTIAFTNKVFMEEMVKKYGSKVAVGVDARDGKVAVNGWCKVTEQDSFEFCSQLAQCGVDTIIYTDIGRDGSMEGANMGAYRRLGEIDGLKVIASGGICNEEEIMELRDIVDGGILGKALYEGALDLKRSIEIGEK